MFDVSSYLETMRTEEKEKIWRGNNKCPSHSSQRLRKGPKRVSSGEASAECFEICMTGYDFGSYKPTNGNRDVYSDRPFATSSSCLDQVSVDATGARVLFPLYSSASIVLFLRLQDCLPLAKVAKCANVAVQDSVYDTLLEHHARKTTEVYCRTGEGRAEFQVVIMLLG